MLIWTGSRQRLPELTYCEPLLYHLTPRCRQCCGSVISVCRLKERMIHLPAPRTSVRMQWSFVFFASCPALDLELNTQTRCSTMTYVLRQLPKRTAMAGISAWVLVDT